MLTELIRRFRGLGIALAVLALSAGVVFAAAPPFVPASSHANPAANSNTDEGEPSASPSDEASQEPSEEPGEDATESPSAEVPTGAAPAAEGPTTEDATGAPEDTHGALVSYAAQMDLPEGFANRGAFVSCVAHMKDVTLATIVWADVTPEACATLKATPPGQARSEAARTGAQDKAATGKDKAATGKAKGQDKAATGKAKGQAQAAAARAKHQH